MTSSDTSKPQREAPPPLSVFSHVREERLRMTDLDFQKHVNNAALTSLFANARFDFLQECVRPTLPDADKLVIAKLEVSFLRELNYGTPVFTGTRVLSVGRTSMRLEHGMYQDGVCASRAVCVFVHVDGVTNKPAPWPQAVGALAPS